MKKDIALALLKEQEYLHRKLIENDNTANIYEYLAEAGYDNLQEFNKDGVDYWIRQQDYIIEEEPYIDISLALPYLENNTSAFLYSIYTGENYAFVTNDYNNSEYLKSKGYKQVKLGYTNSSGPVLSCDGDLRVFLIYLNNELINIPNTYFLEKLKDYLSLYIEDVYIDNNDLMIAGKKVCGSVFLKYNDYVNISILQINFSDRESDILEICGTPKKPFGYIISDQITPEKIKNKILEWLTL